MEKYKNNLNPTITSIVFARRSWGIFSVYIKHFCIVAFCFAKNVSSFCHQKRVCIVFNLAVPETLFYYLLLGCHPRIYLEWLKLCSDECLFVASSTLCDLPSPHPSPHSQLLEAPFFWVSVYEVTRIGGSWCKHAFCLFPARLELYSSVCLSYLIHTQRI